MEQNPPVAQAIPTWLDATSSPGHSVTPHIPQAKVARMTREGQEAVFLAMFERVLGEMVRGRTLKNVIEHDVRQIDYEAFFRWIKRDPARHERYKEAKELRTEWWAGRLVEIADADDSTEDVARSRLRVDTLKWLMGADNRKTYGDTKQVEISQSISITAALEQARARVQMIQPIEDVVDVDTMGLIEHRQEQQTEDND